MIFERALALVLSLEGGKVDDPADSGGRTNRGITQARYGEFRAKLGMEKRDVWEIEDDEIRAIYQESWTSFGCDRIPGRLAVAHFQFAVNSPAAAERTLTAVQWAEAPEDCQVFTYLTLQRDFYRRLARQRPKDLRFLAGWLNRVERTLQAVK